MLIHAEKTKQLKKFTKHIEEFTKGVDKGCGVCGGMRHAMKECETRLQLLKCCRWLGCKKAQVILNRHFTGLMDDEAQQRPEKKKLTK
jgi:hypothetical protein